MADDTEVLLNFCNQYLDEIRHIENQRAALTNIIILIGSAIVGLIVQKGLTRGFLMLAILLILLGIYGAGITLKLYERYNFFQARLEHCYRHIDELHPNAKFLHIRDVAYREHKSRFPRLVKLRVHRLWLAIHIAISLSGVALIVVILFLSPG
ncbi:MAG TPA: hypothetical protein VF546_21540 [Pyrinomonadaceae bacterium]|jgi:hypothetical protein